MDFRIVGQNPVDWLSNHVGSLGAKYKTSPAPSVKVYKTVDGNPAPLKIKSSYAYDYDNDDPAPMKWRGFADHTDPLDAVEKPAHAPPMKKPTGLNADDDQPSTYKTGEPLPAHMAFKVDRKYGGKPTWEKLQAERMDIDFKDPLIETDDVDIDDTTPQTRSSEQARQAYIDASSRFWNVRHRGIHRPVSEEERLRRQREDEEEDRLLHEMDKQRRERERTSQQPTHHFNSLTDAFDAIASGRLRNPPPQGKSQPPTGKSQKSMKALKEQTKGQPLAKTQKRTPRLTQTYLSKKQYLDNLKAFKKGLKASEASGGGGKDMLQTPPRSPPRNLGDDMDVEEHVNAIGNMDITPPRPKPTAKERRERRQKQQAESGTYQIGLSTPTTTKSVKPRMRANERISKAYHDILGVREEDATLDTIVKAYRKQSIKHHPDKGGNPEHQKKINEAYEHLREKYVLDDTRRVSIRGNYNYLLDAYTQDPTIKLDAHTAGVLRHTTKLKQLRAGMTLDKVMEIIRIAYGKQIPNLSVPVAKTTTNYVVDEKSRQRIKTKTQRMSPDKASKKPSKITPDSGVEEQKGRDDDDSDDDMDFTSDYWGDTAAAMWGRKRGR